MEKLNPSSTFSLSLKEIITAIIMLTSLLGIYFTLQASVKINTSDIQALKINTVNPDLVNSTIQRVEEKTDVLGESILEIKTQLEKIDQRLYELSKAK